MKRLHSLDDFNKINESVVGQYTTMSIDEVQSVLNSNIEDFGDDDTPKRDAIVKALETVIGYFEPTEGENLDLRSKIITASGNEDTKKQLFDVAQTFATSLKKIHTIEVGEIEPLTSQALNIISE